MTEPVEGDAGATYVQESLRALRQGDRDRFLCVLAAPPRQRAGLATLYAFNLEIAGIAEKVSEPMLALIRLQWWRDALDEIAAGGHHRHYLVRALQELAAEGLDLAPVRRLLDAREIDADRDAAMPDLAALVAYAEATAGALGEAAATLCVAGAGAELRQAARSAGTAYGLVGLLRATPHLARRRVVRLPGDLMREAGSSADRLRDLRPDANLPRVTAEVADRARSLLLEARGIAQGTAERRAGIGALLPARLAAAQLERLARYGYDPFAAGAVAESGLDIWRLLTARWSARI